MAKKKNHSPEDAYPTLHQPKGGAGGKGCAWKCKQGKDYEVGNQCSYRWHARERGLADAKLYNYPAYKDLCVDHRPTNDDVFETASYLGQNAPHHPTPKNSYALKNRFPFKKRPRPGQWDITLPRNFSESWTRPYWHNAHHIISDSALQRELLATGQDQAQLPTLITQGLLLGEYNLNDKTNMILLPMDRAVATALGLPRHLLEDETEEYEPLHGTRRTADHPDYTRRVQYMLRPVINQYKRLVKSKLGQGHPPAPDALAKEQLVRISETIYKAITAAGPFMKGKSLDELRFGGLGGR